MKKLLIVNWQDRKNPQSGGAERNLHEIFGRLTGEFNITLFVSSFPGGNPEETVDGMRVIRRGHRNNFNLVFYHYYHRYLRHQDFDFLIEDLNKIPFFTPLYSSLPKLCILHHFFGPVIYHETNPLFATYVYFTERMVGKLYKGVNFIAVSESTKKDLINYGIDPRMISVVYNGVDTEFYHPGGEKSKRPLIVSVGRIKRYKTIDHLIQAMVRLKGEIPEVKLVIIGDGDDRKRLVDLTQRLNLTGHIQFTGWITEEKKRDLIRSAWFGVTTSAKEGFGLVNIEIQSCGTPIISADSPGLKESVIHAQTGLLYRYGDIEDLTTKMKALITDRNLREFFGQESRKFALRFSWDKSATEVKRIIDETLTRFRT
ncbi:MAG TPA: glycosyltransferase family 1 protein [bacterium (Candidatus Stahlbacteria)]|nr:glycosyltransferase family 1 protein [Candidatus Stahlbacteria bacterium]